MVTVGDLRRWRPADLRTASAQLGDARARMVAVDDELVAATRPGGWTGPAADSATGTAGQLRGQLAEIVSGIAGSQRALGEAADDLTAVQRMLQDCENLARRNGFAIGDDGVVTDLAAIEAGPPGVVHAQLDARVRARDEVVTMLEQAVRTAADIDAKTAAVLDRAANAWAPTPTNPMAGLAAAGALGEGSGAVTAPTIPANGSPGQNAAWWHTLTPAQQQAIIRDCPEIVGNLDGITAVVRDQANRTVLARQKATLEAERDALIGRGVAADDETLSRVTDRLGGIAAIETRLTEPVDERTPAAMLLGVDATSTETGRAIVAVGNPDTARNVATYVPGFATALKPGLTGDIERADQTVRAADGQSTGPTSAIVWLGYDAPQSLDVSTHGDADRAAPALSGFQDGLRETHQGPPSHNTVIGHSYGSLVTGTAASTPTGLHADDIVFVGSPGVGVDHADQLGLPRDHVFTSTAANDPIREAINPGGQRPDQLYFGQNPDTPAFGAHHFTSDPSTVTHAHSGYWDDRSSSLANLGAIVAGNPERVR